MSNQPEDVQTVIFDDEGQFQDVLAGVGISAPDVLKDLRGLIAGGKPVIIEVPGQPRRALIENTDGTLGAIPIL